MNNFSATAQHLESACKAHAYRQLVKLEELAGKILAGDKSLLPEFVAINNYLREVGLVK